ncbi:MAG: peptidylprolyl isomerase [Bdellovibrionaceae bacterium]|nr:peptidylprolyl isomerase [Pseudobdellovibrionaceae bacterium]
MKAFILALLVASSAQAAREPLEGIVAVVNNEIILRSDVDKFREKIKNNGMIDELLLVGMKPDQLKTDPKAQLNYLISERILDSEIKRLNLAVTIERVEQEIREIAKRNNMSRAELTQALLGQGVRMSEYQQFMKTRIERQALMEQEITSKVRVSDEDVLAEYLRRFPKSESGAEYTLAHIYFNPRKGGPEAAKQRAEEVAAKIKGGQTFDALAEQHSEDSNFTQGGSLGVFKTGEMSPEFERAVQGLQPGESSGVVPSRTGFHILKVVARKVIPDPRFEQEKERLRAVLSEKSFQQQFQHWIETKRDDAFVRINQG